MQERFTDECKRGQNLKEKQDVCTASKYPPNMHCCRGINTRPGYLLLFLQEVELNFPPPEWRIGNSLIKNRASKKKASNLTVEKPCRHGLCQMTKVNTANNNHVDMACSL